MTSQIKVDILKLLHDIKTEGSYIRVAANTLASIYHEDIEDSKIEEIDKNTKFVETLTRKYSEDMINQIKQLEIYENSIGHSEELDKDKLKELINSLTTQSESKMTSIVDYVSNAEKLITTYEDLDLEKSSGFYEETIKGILEIQENSFKVDELFMELCNPVYDKLKESESEEVEVKTERKLIFPEAVNGQAQPWPEEKDTATAKYWVLESSGDVIHYDTHNVVNTVIPLAVFQEKPTFERLRSFFLGTNKVSAQDEHEIHMLITEGSTNGEIGRHVHLLFAEYQLIECYYD